jgi:YVTN family beta-propeller protein
MPSAAVRLFRLLVSLVLCLTACGRPAPAPNTASPPERIVVTTDSGLSLVDPVAGRVLLSAASVVSAPDLARWFGVSDGQLTAFDPRAALAHPWMPVPSGLVPAVVSNSGARLALAEPRGGGANPWLPVARARTRIAIVDPNGTAEPRLLDLDGNFEPEAFSTDDRSLFVLEYLPPQAPDRYRVRQAQLATGEVEQLVDRWKKVPIPNEETMQGTGRQQVAAPDRARLYTLYTHQPEHLHGRDLAAGVSTARGDVHAFVHVLSLSEGWAYCVDLPLPFGVGPASGHALTVTPDGMRVLVIDRTSGATAVVDTASLQVAPTIPGTPDPRADSGLAAAQLSPDGATLYVAGGSEVLAQDAASLAIRQRWPISGAMYGLAVSPDAQRLYLGLEDRLAVLDASTGRELRSFAVPELRSVLSVLAP